MSEQIYRAICSAGLHLYHLYIMGTRLVYCIMMNHLTQNNTNQQSFLVTCVREDQSACRE